MQYVNMLQLELLDDINTLVEQGVEIELLKPLLKQSTELATYKWVAQNTNREGKTFTISTEVREQALAEEMSRMQQVRQELLQRKWEQHFEWKDAMAQELKRRQQRLLDAQYDAAERQLRAEAKAKEDAAKVASRKAWSERASKRDAQKAVVNSLVAKYKQY